MSWNPLVPENQRFPTTAQTAGRPVPKPTHVVIHVTGSTSFNSVKNTFLSSVSAHYLIGQDGKLYQFVQEKDQAWHAGIRSSVQSIYDTKGPDWRKYVMYFDWYKGYPVGSIFLNSSLQQVEGGHSASFVSPPGGGRWPLYNYFDQRWGVTAGPVNYSVSKATNAYSVGIELLSFGAKTPSQTAYTPAMYTTLQRLVRDICSRNSIPQRKGFVVGHEDTNPIQRFGWDPNQGFDWSRVWV